MEVLEWRIQQHAAYKILTLGKKVKGCKKTFYTRDSRSDYSYIRQCIFSVKLSLRDREVHCIIMCQFIKILCTIYAPNIRAPKIYCCFFTLIFFQLQLTFNITFYYFQMCSIVVRQSHTLYSVPLLVPIPSCHHTY